MDFLKKKFNEFVTVNSSASKKNCWTSTRKENNGN